MIIGYPNIYILHKRENSLPGYAAKNLAEEGWKYAVINS